MIEPIYLHPRRVLLAGDWHGNIRAAIYAMRYAAEQGCDGVIQLGDFGIWPGLRGQKYLDDLEVLLDALSPMWCMFIDGNHEDFDQLLDLAPHNGLRKVRERLWHIPRGTRWTWGGQEWLGLGGATSLDRKYRVPGRDWWPQENITLAQAEQVASGGHADVMLTHDCPSGVDIPGLSTDWDIHALVAANQHRELLREVCDVVQPAYLYHGHFHVSYSAATVFGGQACYVRGLGDDGMELADRVTIVELP